MKTAYVIGLVVRQDGTSAFTARRSYASAVLELVIPSVRLSVCLMSHACFVMAKPTSSSAMAERPRELGYFKKAQVNGGTDNDCVKDFHKCLRCR